MPAHEAVVHRDLYRLPWTLPDNAIAWLEPTEKCNLYCEGCYRANVNRHKSLEEVAADLDVFASKRNFDGVSIAGGDPLTHPQVVEIVRMIAERGYKPILNTNGLALEEPLLRELKQAGLVGLTFHIDSKQRRPGWRGKSEVELNELRLHYAKMVARVGNLSCAFNSTVYEDTLPYVPELLEWAGRHIDIVHVMVFICYRAAVGDGDFDFYRGAEKVSMDPLVYSYESKNERVDLTAPEVVSVIRERYPDFQPSAYLNGTQRADSFKWLLTVRFGTRKRIYGYAGPKFVELAQTAHHLATGRYLAYASPKMLRHGRAMMALAPLDRGVRATARRALRDPSLLLQRMHLQSVMIIQPVDFLADGRQDMCDGCPDMTVWQGDLAWSCRLEECKYFGQFLSSVPKGDGQQTGRVSSTPSSPAIE